LMFVGVSVNISVSYEHVVVTAICSYVRRPLLRLYVL
jgi:hypothetical protein